MKLFGILILALSFSQCASMKMDTQPPFKVKNASYSHITGGQPGNSVLNLMIEISTPETVDFKNVYFQNRITPAVIEEKVGKQYIAARYKISSDQERKDLVLSSDAKTEFGNTAHETKEKFPFELKENEAVVTYKIGEKIHYYKIENVKKEKSVFMPSARPQN